MTSRGSRPGRPVRVRRAGALSLQVGALEEAEGFMGASPRGALGRARSRTLFGGLAAQFPLGRRAAAPGGEPAAWRVRLSAYAGRTTPELRGAGVSETPDVLLSSAFGASLSRRTLLMKGDRLAFSLSQPLRIESGALRLRLPASRTRSRGVLHQVLPVNLEPSGRSLEWLISYGAGIGPARLHAALGLTRHPGHSRFAETERRAWLLLDMPLRW